MRSGRCACACTLLLAGFAAGELYSTPQVSMSAKLQKTLAGRIVQRRLEGYVGQRIEFVVRIRDKRRRYTGTIEQIIVPDIAEYIATGDYSKARFKAKLSDVQPQDPQDNNHPLPDTAELSRSNIGGVPGVGHVQSINVAELLGSVMGDGYLKARLVAKYKNNNGETYWEGLVEMVEGYLGKHETEPFVVLLSEKEDFMEIIATAD